MMRQPDATPIADEIINRLDDFASSLTLKEAAGGFCLEDIFVRAGITSNSRDAAFNQWSGMIKDYLRQCGWKRHMLMWYPPVVVASASVAFPEAEQQHELPEAARQAPPVPQQEQKKASYRELLASRGRGKSDRLQLPPGNSVNTEELH